MGRLCASAMCNGIGTITIDGHASGASLMKLPSMISGLVFGPTKTIVASKARRRFLRSKDGCPCAHDHSLPPLPTHTPRPARTGGAFLEGRAYSLAFKPKPNRGGKRWLAGRHTN